MGLDQYAHAKRENEDEGEEIAYWRKHNRLRRKRESAHDFSRGVNRVTSILYQNKGFFLNIYNFSIMKLGR